MIEALTTLEEKAQALIATVTRLRDENTKLRNQVLQLQTSRQAAEQKVALATQRIEAILEKLPQDQSNGQA